MFFVLASFLHSGSGIVIFNIFKYGANHNFSVELRVRDAIFVAYCTVNSSDHS